MQSILDKIQVIYEDADVLVINKPAGLTVHPTKPRSLGKDRPAGCRPTLADWLVDNYPAIKKVGDKPALRPGIVHRLDKDTSGVLIAAKKQKSFRFLKDKFKNREVKKEYLALVIGTVKQAKGFIKRPIGRSRKRGVKRRTFQKFEKTAKKAHTEFKRLEAFENFSLLKIVPITGRTHQIRVHLASIGHPIAGDRMYGSWKKQPQIQGLNRSFLHAFALELTLPSGKATRFESPLPSELKTVLKSLTE